MAIHKIALKYNGRVDLVTVHEADRFAYMEDRFKAKLDLVGVVGVSCEPGSRLVHYKLKNGRTVVYDPDKDPTNFIIDWRLHNTAFLKDQTYEGAKLSDYAYWSQQLRNYRSSTFWGLIHVCYLDKKQASIWTNRGVKIFKQELLITRGLDLNRPMNAAEIDNDRSISEKMAAREFHSGQSLK